MRADVSGFTNAHDETPAEVFRFCGSPQRVARGINAVLIRTHYQAIEVAMQASKRERRAFDIAWSKQPAACNCSR